MKSPRERISQWKLVGSMHLILPRMISFPKMWIDENLKILYKAKFPLNESSHRYALHWRNILSYLRNGSFKLLTIEFRRGRTHSSPNERDSCSGGMRDHEIASESNSSQSSSNARQREFLWPHPQRAFRERLLRLPKRTRPTLVCQSLSADQASLRPLSFPRFSAYGRREFLPSSRVK